jgi:O-succinylbenzoate synthase
VGLGEAAPLAAFGSETVDEAEAGCRELGEWLDDERLASISPRLACLRNAASAARTGLTGERFQPAQKSLGVAALLAAGQTALTQIQSKAEMGFRVFKWKVGVGDAADEMVLLDDVCAALPGGAKLRLDANGAWDRRRAERWLERCADRPVEFVEQPCFAGVAQRAAERGRTEDLLLGLAADYPTPIALDESLATDGDVERWIGAGWPGVFVVKPSLLGDPGEVLSQLAKAKAQVVFSSALETAVGAQAALRRAFAWSGEPRALGFGVWPLFADATFDGPVAGPFLRSEDVERMDPETTWNALN